MDRAVERISSDCIVISSLDCWICNLHVVFVDGGGLLELESLVLGSLVSLWLKTDE